VHCKFEWCGRISFLCKICRESLDVYPGAVKVAWSKRWNLEHGLEAWNISRVFLSPFGGSVCYAHGAFWYYRVLFLSFGCTQFEAQGCRNVRRTQWLVMLDF